MERDDRPPVATFFVERTFTAGTHVSLAEAAAHHARVKRLDVGDRVQLTDGRGSVGVGELVTLRKNDAEVAVDAVRSVVRDAPIHLRVPVGDRDRMLWLAEKATELGVASWQAVRFTRSMSVSPRGEGSAFADKVRARMISALEQSGGAWLPELLADAGVSHVVLPPHADRVLLDIAGAPLAPPRPLTPAAESVVLFGPEGGVEAREREVLIAAGWRLARVAGNTLRFETAGLAAVSVLRAAALLTEG